MSDCIFCAIVAGESPAHRIDEDEHTLAFLDIAPFARGHTLVVPKTHAPDLFATDEDTAAAVMRATHRVAHRLRERLSPEGMNVLQSNGRVAFQTVFHLHVHLIPRWASDALSVPPWPKPPAPQDELRRLAAQLQP